MPDPVWVICTKCGSKFDAAFLERRRQYSCPMCAEPGLRIMDAKGNATEESWPPESST